MANKPVLWSNDNSTAVLLDQPEGLSDLQADGRSRVPAAAAEAPAVRVRE